MPSKPIFKKPAKLISAIFILINLINCKTSETPAQEENGFKIVNINSDWFEVNYLAPKTYIIEEPKSSQGNVSYLIIGDEKAIMLDTGSGENETENGFKIKHIMDQLIDLPISLLLSHFHFDHNQNIAEFENVAFPDLPFLRQKVAADNIYSFTQEDLFEGTNPSQTEVNEWLPVNTDIDLGNRKIQLINIPGHTKESISIIDHENKMAFLGDYLYNGELFLFNENDFAPYEESTDRLLSILTDEYKLYGAHGVPEIEFNKLQKLKNFLRCIDENNCLPTPTVIWGFPVNIYKFEGMQIVVFL